MFQRVSPMKTRTDNHYRPFYFGGSAVPTVLGLTPKQFDGTGMIKEQKVSKTSKPKLYQKGKRMV